MKNLHIKQKLNDLGMSVETLTLGDFDKLAHFTAIKYRNESDPLYKSVGWSFKPNVERAILVYSLIRSYNLKSFLEIGTGRGLCTFSACKAFHDMGVKGLVSTVDVNVQEEFFNGLRKLFPHQWFDMITFNRGTSSEYFQTHSNERFDLVYIDGAHDYQSVKDDINSANNVANKLILCDDYHLPSKYDPGIECRLALDEFDWKTNQFHEPELIKMDRRIFVDDRKLTDDAIDYGQLLFTRNSLQLNVGEW